MSKLSIVTALALAFAAPSAFAEEKVKVRLVGFQEVPSVSTPGHGTFEAEINKAGTHIDWTLTYADMQADVLQAHIHFGQRHVNGGIVLWLCKTTQTSAPANTATCTPREGTFTGTFTGDDVQTVTAQGIAAGELGEVIAAIRAGVAYANVHTAQSTGGEIRAQLPRDRGRRGGHNE